MSEKNRIIKFIDSVTGRNRLRRIDKNVNELRNYLVYHGLIKSIKKGETEVSLLSEILLDDVKKIPASNGGEECDFIPLNLGIISDEYMYNYYKDVFKNTLYININEDISNILSNVDLLIVTSSWSGVFGELSGWRSNKKIFKNIKNIMNLCRNSNKFTIFQSIEDPVHYEEYLPLAQCADIVLTSDSGSIDRYKHDCKHGNIFYGEYGINPLIHNPIGCRARRRDMAFFAGSWMNQYPERCKDILSVFEQIDESGVPYVIADRNSSSRLEGVVFPTRFSKNIIPAVGHLELQRLHKLFAYNVNINTVKDSPTMCAMRVYELQGMGTTIVSNYARSVAEKFPEIRILHGKSLINSQEMVKNAPDVEYYISMVQLYNIMNNFTSYEQVCKIIAHNKNFNVDVAIKNIAVFYKSTNSDNDNKIKKYFEKQSIKNKILINISEIKNNDDWEKLILEKNVLYFTWFFEGHEYEPYYLNGLYSALKYTSPKYVTKNSYYGDGGRVDGPEHEYTNIMSGIDKTLFLAKYFSPLDFAAYSYEQVTLLDGGYSIDCFELNYLKYWSATYKNIEKKPYVMDIVIPVQKNEGRALLGRLFRSLLDNSLFFRCRVVMLAVGELDDITINLIEWIVRRFHNVEKNIFNEAFSEKIFASYLAQKAENILLSGEYVILYPYMEACARTFDRVCEGRLLLAGERKVDVVTFDKGKAKEECVMVQMTE